jgi:ribosomal protein S18 acetylase RimI-like enzyme
MSGRKDDAPTLERFNQYERRLLERLSTRTEPFEHGVAYFDEDYPERYNSNFLLADHGLDDVSPEVLIEAADQILGKAGFDHRQVSLPDHSHGGRLAPAFAERGYTVGCDVVMALRRTPDRGADLMVEELGFEHVRPLILEMYRRDPRMTPKTVPRLTDQHGKFERVIGARFFVVRVDGHLAGDCELYLDGLDAQVENVGTLEEFRGRGIARAVVLRATEAARDAGAHEVFIVADDDDWPKDLYGRLGFDAVGRPWQFLKWPDL